MTTVGLLDYIDKYYRSCKEIVSRKNRDYATNDDAFKNFRFSEYVGVPVERAILVRITDKISRISNLLDKEPDVKDESIKDTLQDACNYLAILSAYMEDNK
jgi:hypothetical protein